MKGKKIMKFLMKKFILLLFFIFYFFHPSDPLAEPLVRALALTPTMFIGWVKHLVQLCVGRRGPRYKFPPNLYI
jgi:hypothetical protein